MYKAVFYFYRSYAVRFEGQDIIDTPLMIFHDVFNYFDYYNDVTYHSSPLTATCLNDYRLNSCLFSKMESLRTSFSTK